MIQRTEDRRVTPAPTVGVVGLGYGRAHIVAFQSSGCRVVAVCQRDRARAQKIADQYGVPGVFERWEDLLERAQPEIVVIATPPHLHHAITLAAFDRGAHVLCEKPLALTAAEARAMADAARRAGRVGMTGFNWRFTPAMRELEARVRAGALGRLFHVQARWLGSTWAGASAAPTWRMDRAQAGHGAMGDMGVHLVDLVRATFGELARVSAHAGVAYPARSAPGVARPADADDHCALVGELTDGAQVALAVSRVAHGASEHTIDAFGSRGALRYRVARGGERWWEGELYASEDGGPPRRVTPRTAAPDVGDAAPPDVIGRVTIVPLVARFLEGIRTGVSPSPSLEDGVRAQAVLDAVLESARRRAWVDVAAASPPGSPIAGHA
jgi:predicted dehydrogenase